MKNLKVLSLALVLTLLVSASSLYAEEIKTSGYASVDVMSNYVWRGFKLSNSTVVQPSVGISYGGFGANLWANYDANLEEHTETDLTLNYSGSFNKFNVVAGYIYYALDGAEDTQELYFSVGYDTLLKPMLSLYYDFDEGDGAFLIASIGHDIALSKEFALSLGASASYNTNSEYSIGDYSGFHNGEVSASLRIPVMKSFTLTPKMAYSFPLSNDAKDAMKTISNDGDKEIFYGGINLSLSF